jgi:hypothetical protein
MKLIRWLLSNIILIALVLALTYAYVYWDNLTGEDTPAGKAIAYLSVEYDEVREFLDSYDFDGDKPVDAIPPEPANRAVETASVPQVTPPSRPQARPPAQQQPMPERPMQQPARPQPMAQQQAVQTSPMMQQQAVQTSPMMQQQALPPQAMRPRPSVPPQAMLQQQPPVQQPAQRTMPPRGMPQQPPAMPQVQTESAPTPADQRAADADAPISMRELWISAREEFHRGNFDASIRNYQKVIASSTDNFDAYGEMGNVYLRMGSPAEAANAYYEAAEILVRKGQLRRAGSLIPMLQRLDRSKAEELNQLLANSTRS